MVLLGAPGAGKGTQAKMISTVINVPHISTGDIFRKNIAEMTDLGKKAKEFIEKGMLVSDEVTNDIVRNRILEDDCRNGFILDGYPRTIAQAKYLDNIAKSYGFSINAAINISVPDNVIVERMAGRRACAKCGAIYHLETKPPKLEGICDLCGANIELRVDDAPETVSKRLALYHSETAPLIDYYMDQGKLVTIDGTKSIEEIQSDMKAALGIKK